MERETETQRENGKKAKKTHSLLMVLMGYD